MNEIWKDIEGYEGLYQVSNFGRIKGLARKVKTKGGAWKTISEKIMKPYPARYMLVQLSKEHKTTTYSVHRIVAKAFIPNPENKPEVNHKDFNKLNNFVENLEWTTKLENENWNLKDETMSEKILMAQRTATEKTKVKVNQFSLDGELVRTWDSYKDAERALGINSVNICSCCNGRLKTSGGYVWQKA